MTTYAKPTPEAISALLSQLWAGPTRYQNNELGRRAFEQDFLEACKARSWHVSTDGAPMDFNTGHWLPYVPDRWRFCSAVRLTDAQGTQLVPIPAAGFSATRVHAGYVTIETPEDIETTVSVRPGVNWPHGTGARVRAGEASTSYNGCVVTLLLRRATPTKVKELRIEDTVPATWSTADAKTIIKDIESLVIKGQSEPGNVQETGADPLHVLKGLVEKYAAYVTEPVGSRPSVGYMAMALDHLIAELRLKVRVAEGTFAPVPCPTCKKLPAIEEDPVVTGGSAAKWAVRCPDGHGQSYVASERHWAIDGWNRMVKRLIEGDSGITKMPARPTGYWDPENQ